MNRTLVLLLCLVALIAGWIAHSGFSTPHASAGSPGSLAPKIEGSRVYFVPMGSFSSDDLPTLARYYRGNYKLDITILKSIPLDDAVRDSSRGQLMAEKLVESVRAGVPEYTNDPRAILIGFTSEDIYPTSQNWQFAFGWRLGSSHAAVVFNGTHEPALHRTAYGFQFGRNTPEEDGHKGHRHPLLWPAAKPESEERSLQRNYGD